MVGWCTTISFNMHSAVPATYITNGDQWATTHLFYTETYQKRLVQEHWALYNKGEPFEPMLSPQNKENFNPILKTYSPKRLINQKRYRILKAFTEFHTEKITPRPKPNLESEEFITPIITFVDETVPRYGELPLV